MPRGADEIPRSMPKYSSSFVDVSMELIRCTSMYIERLRAYAYHTATPPTRRRSYPSLALGEHSYENTRISGIR